MEMTAATIEHYLGVAFSGMNRVLDRLDDDSVNVRPGDWGTNSVAGLIVHCCELAPSWFETAGLGRHGDRDREGEFAATATIGELQSRIEATLVRIGPIVQDFVTGPTAGDHELRVFLPGDDHSDAALVLHVFEELFQHLGHMEVTADAVGRP